MSTQQIITNIAHKIMSPTTNVLYFKHSSVFDYIFNMLDINIFMAKSMPAYYYDLIITNDFLSYHNETKNLSKTSHLNHLLLFHNTPPATFKKEDIYIFQKEVKANYKIFFGQSLANSWKSQLDPQTKIIDYGIPDIGISAPSARQKSIIILNFENNNQLDALYRHIKNQSIDCDILQNADSQHFTIIDLAHLLSNYKICINISTYINTLFAVSCGCQCISPFQMNDNKLFITSNDYSDIISSLNIALNTNISEDERQHYGNMIKDSYKYDSFCESIYEQINLLKKACFIL